MVHYCQRPGRLQRAPFKGGGASGCDFSRPAVGTSPLGKVWRRIGRANFYFVWMEYKKRPDGAAGPNESSGGQMLCRSRRAGCSFSSHLQAGILALIIAHFSSSRPAVGGAAGALKGPLISATGGGREQIDGHQLSRAAPPPARAVSVPARVASCYWPAPDSRARNPIIQRGHSRRSSVAATMARRLNKCPLVSSRAPPAFQLDELTNIGLRHTQTSGHERPIGPPAGGLFGRGAGALPAEVSHYFTRRGPGRPPLGGHDRDGHHDRDSERRCGDRADGRLAGNWIKTSPDAKWAPFKWGLKMSLLAGRPAGPVRRWGSILFRARSPSRPEWARAGFARRGAGRPARIFALLSRASGARRQPLISSCTERAREAA